MPAYTINVDPLITPEVRKREARAPYQLWWPGQNDVLASKNIQASGKTGSERFFEVYEPILRDKHINPRKVVPSWFKKYGDPGLEKLVSEPGWYERIEKNYHEHILPVRDQINTYQDQGKHPYEIWKDIVEPKMEELGVQFNARAIGATWQWNPGQLATPEGRAPFEAAYELNKEEGIADMAVVPHPDAANAIGFAKRNIEARDPKRASGLARSWESLKPKYQDTLEDAYANLDPSRLDPWKDKDLSLHPLERGLREAQIAGVEQDQEQVRAASRVAYQKAAAQGSVLHQQAIASGNLDESIDRGAPVTATSPFGRDVQSFLYRTEFLGQHTYNAFKSGISLGALDNEEFVQTYFPTLSRAEAHQKMATALGGYTLASLATGRALQAAGSGLWHLHSFYRDRPFLQAGARELPTLTKALGGTSTTLSKIGAKPFAKGAAPEMLIGRGTVAAARKLPGGKALLGAGEWQGNMVQQALGWSLDNAAGMIAYNAVRKMAGKEDPWQSWQDAKKQISTAAKFAVFMNMPQTAIRGLSHLGRGFAFDEGIELDPDVWKAIQSSPKALDAFRRGQPVSAFPEVNAAHHAKIIERAKAKGIHIDPDDPTIKAEAESWAESQVARAQKRDAQRRADMELSRSLAERVKDFTAKAISQFTARPYTVGKGSKPLLREASGELAQPVQYSYGLAENLTREAAAHPTISAVRALETQARVEAPIAHLPLEEQAAIKADLGALKVWETILHDAQTKGKRYADPNSGDLSDTPRTGFLDIAAVHKRVTDLQKMYLSGDMEAPPPSLPANHTSAHLNSTLAALQLPKRTADGIRATADLLSARAQDPLTHQRIAKSLAKLQPDTPEADVVLTALNAAAAGTGASGSDLAAYIQTRYPLAHYDATRYRDAQFGLDPALLALRKDGRVPHKLPDTTNLDNALGTISGEHAANLFYRSMSDALDDIAIRQMDAGILTPASFLDHPRYSQVVPLIHAQAIAILDSAARAKRLGPQNLPHAQSREGGYLSNLNGWDIFNDYILRAEREILNRHTWNRAKHAYGTIGDTRERMTLERQQAEAVFGRSPKDASGIYDPQTDTISFPGEPPRKPTPGDPIRAYAHIPEQQANLFRTEGLSPANPLATPVFVHFDPNTHTPAGHVTFALPVRMQALSIHGQPPPAKGSPQARIDAHNNNIHQAIRSQHQQIQLTESPAKHHQIRSHSITSDPIRAAQWDDQINLAVPERELRTPSGPRLSRYIRPGHQLVSMPHRSIQPLDSPFDESLRQLYRQIPYDEMLDLELVDTNGDFHTQSGDALEIFPTPVAKLFNDIEKINDSATWDWNAASKVLRKTGISSFVKPTLLTNPAAAIGYISRNFTTDLTTIFTHHRPEVVQHMLSTWADSVQQIHKHYSSPDKLRNWNAAPIWLQDSLRHGVLDSDLVGAGNLPEIRSQQLVSLTKAIQGLPTNDPKQFRKAAKEIITRVAYKQGLETAMLLEQGMRSSLFRAMQDFSFHHNGNIAGTGRSLASQLQGLSTPEANAKIARETVGDYNALSPFAAGTRKWLLPYVAFIDTNHRGSLTDIVNNFSAKSFGVANSNSPLAGLAVSTPTLLAYFNHVLFPALTGSDTENQLPEDTFSTPHLLIPHLDPVSGSFRPSRPDGKTTILRTPSQIAEFLNFIPGLQHAYRYANVAISDLKNSVHAQLGTLSTAGHHPLRKYLHPDLRNDHPVKQAAKASLTAHFQAISPVANLSYEQITGTQTYPNLFSNRTLYDRFAPFASIFAGKTGKILYEQLSQPQKRSQHNQSVSSFLIDNFLLPSSASDINELNYYDAIELTSAFAKDLGRSPGGRALDAIPILNLYRKALSRGDANFAENQLHKLFDKGSVNEVIKFQNEAKRILKRKKPNPFADKGSPLAGINKSEFLPFLNSLSPFEKNQLSNAISYYYNTVNYAAQFKKSLRAFQTIQPDKDLMHQVQQFKMTYGLR